MIIFIGVLPLLIASPLAYFKFYFNTSEFLGLTVQLIWGILFSLGGGLVYLSNIKYDLTNVNHIYRKAGSDKIQSLCFPLIIHTLCFIGICLVFPAREIFIKNLQTSRYVAMADLADSLFFGFMVVPSIASILVGAWCVYMALYHKAI